MPLYKRKPLIVEAHQMTVHLQEQEMLASRCNGLLQLYSLNPAHNSLQVPLGQETKPGDWIVKEADGNYYVYKAPYFELTHVLIHERREDGTTQKSANR